MCIRDRHFGLPAVVAINEFPTDTAAELKLVEDRCRELGVNVVLSQVWGKGDVYKRQVLRRHSLYIHHG